MRLDLRNLLVLVVLGQLVLPVYLARAQTRVSVAANPVDRAVDQVEAPPHCDFPCDQLFILPAFARNLSLAGPDGHYATELTRKNFINRLEAWRQFYEMYRRSIELKQARAPDWRKANIAYKVELGQYEQFFESYRNAYQMDQAGHIRYGSVSE